ncbi:MAG: hypothetical protein ACK54C_05285, partial [Betaproteobacteria bacterium]
FFSYPWIRDRVKRRYMLGCLKAFAKSGFERKFYDLGRVGYTGPQSLNKVDFHFDKTRRLSQEQVVEFATVPVGRKSLRLDEKTVQVQIKACGGGTEQLTDQLTDTGPVYGEMVGKVADPKRQDQSEIAAAKLCGGGGQWEDPDEPEEPVITEVRRDTSQAKQVAKAG